MTIELRKIEFATLDDDEKEKSKLKEIFMRLKREKEIGTAAELYFGHKGQKADDHSFFVKNDEITGDSIWDKYSRILFRIEICRCERPNKFGVYLADIMLTDDPKVEVIKKYLSNPCKKCSYLKEPEEKLAEISSFS